jgi:thymidylate synthase (FAD)
MKAIKPYSEILNSLNGQDVLKHIELCGRVCYKSEDKITDESSLDFVKKIIKNGHEAVIEHYSLSVRFVCDRGVSHEIVRHRIASFAQESTRYVNYSNGVYGGNLTFIKPLFWEEGSDQYTDWESACIIAEQHYNALIENGAKPQEARSVLPNSIKTEIIMTANLREWRHFFKLRTSIAAHPQMREITIPLLEQLKQTIPVIFDDITY